MHFDSKKTSLIILAVTSLLSSRAMFAFFDDPEGPNLLIVTVIAAIVYGLSFALYRFLPLTREYNLKRLLLTILIQIIIVTVFYFGLNFV